MKIIHPYTDTNSLRPLRGNFHTHTTRSDGACPPQQVIDDYAARGYDFLMLSDHDIYTSAEDLTKLDSKGMVLIPGNEVSRGGPHLLHIGEGGFVEPNPQRQAVISEIVQRGGLAVVNHPNWHADFNHCTIAQMREWVGYMGMEIFNGVIQRLPGSPYATDKWDQLLSAGRRIWGFANDDSHHPARDVALGWNMVYARQRSAEGVIDALREGRFYASTGVKITKIEVGDDTIRIETTNAHRINAFMQGGTRFAFADAGKIEIKVPANAIYVRFECWGAGEQFAWTQPFFIVAETDKGAAKQFLTQWYVADIMPGLALHQARPVTPRDSTLRWTELEAGSGSPPDGFLDTRAQSSARDGVVYCWTKIESPVDGQGLLYLGFDGPVRAWVNGEPVFDGPGTNPATPDKVAVNVTFRKGANELVVALDTNEGKAWGIFARCDLNKSA